MKKILLATLLIFLTIDVGVSSIVIKRTLDYKKFQSKRDIYLEQVFRLMYPDEIVMYVFDQSLIEGVNPIDMIAILQVENSKHDPNAENINYKKVWNKKKKCFIFKVDSIDQGLYQLNSKHIEEFLSRFWIPYETEIFDANNYKHNARVAIRLYKFLLKTYKNEQYAICAYNGGSGNVDRNTVPQKTIKEYLPLFLQYKSIMIKEK